MSEPADSELNFSVISNWDYAARVAPPELIKQVVKENIAPSWIGDAKRFSAIVIDHKKQAFPLYLIQPAIRDECPNSFCDADLSALYRPLCGATGGCTYLGYIDARGSYQRVFKEQLWAQVPTNNNSNFVQVSHQLINGLPCLEFMAFTSDTIHEGKGNNKIWKSRFCFNGREYYLQHQYSISPEVD